MSNNTDLTSTPYEGDLIHSHPDIVNEALERHQLTGRCEICDFIDTGLQWEGQQLPPEGQLGSLREPWLEE